MFNQLIGKLYNHRNSNSWSAKLRQKRLSFFCSLMDLIPKTQTSVKILDVGGIPEFWQSLAFLEQTPVNIEIYIVNIGQIFMRRKSLV